MADDTKFYFTVYPLNTDDGEIFKGNIGLMFYDVKWLKEIGSKCGIHIDELDGCFENKEENKNILANRNSCLNQWVLSGSLAE